MKDERLDVVRGSSNVCRDLGQDNAVVKQFKALLAVEIIRLSIGNVYPCVGRPPVPASPRRTSPVYATRTWGVLRSTAWWGSSIALARGSKSS
jgi:hypothetical protein